MIDNTNTNPTADLMTDYLEKEPRMHTKIGAWATITDGDSIEWSLCGDWIEFHIGELDLTVSAKALATLMTAAQSAQRQLLASARQRHPSAVTEPEDPELEDTEPEDPESENAVSENLLPQVTS